VARHYRKPVRKEQPRPSGQDHHLPHRDGRKGGRLDRLRPSPRARGGSCLAERIQQRGLLHGEGGGRAHRRLAPAPLFTLIVGPSKETKDVGETKNQIAERYGIRRRWWTQLVERSANVSKLHAHIAPGEYSWIGTSSGIRGLNLNYTVTQEEVSAELYIDRGKESERGKQGNLRSTARAPERD